MVRKKKECKSGRKRVNWMLKTWPKWKKRVFFSFDHRSTNAS